MADVGGGRSNCPSVSNCITLNFLQSSFPPRRLVPVHSSNSCASFLISFFLFLLLDSKSRLQASWSRPRRCTECSPRAATAVPHFGLTLPSSSSNLLPLQPLDLCFPPVATRCSSWPLLLSSLPPLRRPSSSSPSHRPSSS